jgi:hypothetical protein
MASLVAIESTLSPEELVLTARWMAIQHQERKTEVAVISQALLTIWPHLKEMTTGSDLEASTNMVGHQVALIRRMHPTTAEFQQLTDDLWPLSSYIHFSRNVTNILPLLRNRAYRQAIRDEIEMSFPGSSETGKSTRSFLIDLYSHAIGMVWVILDQLLVREPTKVAANELVQTTLHPLLVHLTTEDRDMH